jgi:hypothetical protein
LPDEQSSMQVPVAGQVSSHDPDEQSIVQGDEVHVEMQRPLEQGHEPLVQLCIDRPASAAGSATAGPPLGVAPTEPPLVPPLEPHAKRMNERRTAQALEIADGMAYTFARLLLDGASDCAQFFSAKTCNEGPIGDVPFQPAHGRPLRRTGSPHDDT